MIEGMIIQSFIVGYDDLFCATFNWMNGTIMDLFKADFAVLLFLQMSPYNDFGPGAKSSNPESYFKCMR